MSQVASWPESLYGPVINLECHRFTQVPPWAYSLYRWGLHGFYLPELSQWPQRTDHILTHWNGKGVESICPLLTAVWRRRDFSRHCLRALPHTRHKSWFLGWPRPQHLQVMVGGWREWFWRCVAWAYLDLACLFFVMGVTRWRSCTLPIVWSCTAAASADLQMSRALAKIGSCVAAALSWSLSAVSQFDLVGVILSYSYRIAWYG